MNLLNCIFFIPCLIINFHVKLVLFFCRVVFVGGGRGDFPCNCFMTSPALVGR